MGVIRKPHNLVTAYWDDILYFLAYSEKIEQERFLYDEMYQAALKNISANNPLKEKAPQLPTFDKRGFRYCILSSFLFLEAFINAEYTTNIYKNIRINQLSPIQKNNIEDQLKKRFEEKWNDWIMLLAQNNTLKLKGEKPYQDLMKLINWRNHLTHYKIHNIMFVAHEIETIANARKAVFVARQTIKWYYSKTNFKTPEWILRDVLSQMPFPSSNNNP